MVGYEQRNAVWARAYDELSDVALSFSRLQYTFSWFFQVRQMPSRIVLRSLGDLPWPQQITRRALKRRLRGRHA